MVSLGILTIQLHIPGCASLKEKRGRLKPLLSKLHKEFNISVAEIDYHDKWQDAIIACALVSNNNRHTQRVLVSVPEWVDHNWPDVDLIDDEIELI